MFSFMVFTPCVLITRKTLSVGIFCLSTDARTELAAGNLTLRRTLEARYSNSQVDATLMMYILNVSHIRKGF